MFFCTCCVCSGGALDLILVSIHTSNMTLYTLAPFTSSISLNDCCCACCVFDIYCIYCISCICCVCGVCCVDIILSVVPFLVGKPLNDNNINLSPFFIINNNNGNNNLIVILSSFTSATLIVSSFV